MKKLLFLLALVIAAGFTACENPNNPSNGPYTVSFDANGGIGGMAEPVAVTYGQAMPALTATAPVRTGYIFDGYFDAESGGTRYYNADLTSAQNWDKKENTTLYGGWTAKTYIIHFDSNSGYDGPDDLTATYGQPMPVIAAADKPQNGLSHFTGYFDAVSSGTMYYNADLTSAKNWDKDADGTVTLYAQWSSDPLTTVIFDANEGIGSMPNQQIPENTSAALNANTFTRTGYTFGGWTTTSGGTAVYTDGANYTAGAGIASVTLYAVWTGKTYTIGFNNTGGTGGQTGTVTATFSQPMPVITAVPSSDDGTFNGYWDAAVGGKKYYNADKSSAANWDKDATGTTTLYAQFVSLTAPSVVSLVQSTTVTQAANFTYTEILALTREAIELAGGLSGIVKSGDVVVLKPNVIVTGWNWGTPSATNHIPELVSGICTDRRVIQAVAEIVRDIIGPYNPGTGKGKIMVIEGSGSGSTATNFSNLGYTLANLTEVNEIIALDNEGSWTAAGNASGSTDYVTQVTLDNFVYTGATGNYTTYYKNDGKYYVNKKMYEADALICIPVVKNHWNAGVTGSIKNISIGAAPPRIYGQTASNIGRNNMVNHNSPLLHDWIADYFSCLPADFVVMDGLQGLQNGPEPGVSNATGLAQHQKNLRLILASRDPLAIDTVEANIVGSDYTSVRYLTNLTTRGQAQVKPNGRVITLRGDPKDIVVLGNKKVDDVRGDYTHSSVNFTAYAGTRIAQKNPPPTPPTVTITSASFSGSNLNLNLTLSTGANNNVVKIDVYVDGTYTKSFNTGMTSVSFNASSLAAGSHNIEVRAFTQYMYCATATTTAAK